MLYFVSNLLLNLSLNVLIILKRLKKLKYYIIKIIL
jgi:hypothetical protein